MDGMLEFLASSVRHPSRFGFIVSSGLGPCVSLIERAHKMVSRFPRHNFFSLREVAHSCRNKTNRVPSQVLSNLYKSVYRFSVSICYLVAKSTKSSKREASSLSSALRLLTCHAGRFSQSNRKFRSINSAIDYCSFTRTFLLLNVVWGDQTTSVFLRTRTVDSNVCHKTPRYGWRFPRYLLLPFDSFRFVSFRFWNKSSLIVSHSTILPSKN